MRIVLLDLPTNTATLLPENFGVTFSAPVHREGESSTIDWQAADLPNITEMRLLGSVTGDDFGVFGALPPGHTSVFGFAPECPLFVKVSLTLTTGEELILPVIQLWTPIP